MTNTAQLRARSYAFLSTEDERRVVARWRTGVIAFYGSILLIALAATSQRPQADQLDLASNDFVTYHMSSPPLP